MFNITPRTVHDISIKGVTFSLTKDQVIVLSLYMTYAFTTKSTSALMVYQSWGDYTIIMKGAGDRDIEIEYQDSRYSDKVYLSNEDIRILIEELGKHGKKVIGTILPIISGVDKNGVGLSTNFMEKEKGLYVVITESSSSGIKKLGQIALMKDPDDSDEIIAVKGNFISEEDFNQNGFNFDGVTTNNSVGF